MVHLYDESVLEISVDKDINAEPSEENPPNALLQVAN